MLRPSCRKRRVEPADPCRCLLPRGKRSDLRQLQPADVLEEEPVAVVPRFHDRSVWRRGPCRGIRKDAAIRVDLPPRLVEKFRPDGARGLQHAREAEILHHELEPGAVAEMNIQLVDLEARGVRTETAHEPAYRFSSAESLPELFLQPLFEVRGPIERAGNRSAYHSRPRGKWPGRRSGVPMADGVRADDRSDAA